MAELFGKTIVFDGDSICDGSRTAVNGERVAWAGIVGCDYGMDWYNYSRGGATVTAEMYQESTGIARHWLSRFIDTIKERHESLDYLILEGGPALLSAQPNLLPAHTIGIVPDHPGHTEHHFCSHIPDFCLLRRLYKSVPSEIGSADP